MSAVDWVPDSVASAVDILIESYGREDAETLLEERVTDTDGDTDEHETAMAALAELRRRNGGDYL